MWDMLSGYKMYSGMWLWVGCGLMMYLMPELADEKLMVVMKDYVAMGLLGVGGVHKLEKWMK